jgi:hypothetical protein
MLNMFLWNVGAHGLNGGRFLVRQLDANVHATHNRESFHLRQQQSGIANNVSRFVVKL